MPYNEGKNKLKGEINMTLKQAKLTVKLEEARYLRDKYLAKGELYWADQMAMTVKELEMKLSK